MRKLIWMYLFLVCCAVSFASDKNDLDGRTYYIKSSEKLDKPTLFIWCHPSGGDAKAQFDWWANANITADNTILLCPQSKGRLWSMKDDEKFTAKLIKKIVKKYKVNKKSIIFGGHSSGAVYTYNFGLKNQSTFSDLVPACGLMQKAPKAKKGHKPKIHIYHGKKDPVFSFKSASETKDTLTKLKYTVEFSESENGHNLPIKVQEVVKKIIKNLNKDES